MAYVPCSFALGGEHSCILGDNGDLRCFGHGSFGRLGYGNTNSIGDNELPSSVGAVVVATSPIVQVAAGVEHSCALLSNGKIRCWGHGEGYRLGYTHTNDIGDDEQAGAAGDVPLLPAAVQVSAGSRHSCALFVGNEIRCWGSNDMTGVLGLGHQMSPVAPVDGLVDVVGVPATEVPLQVATATQHTCVLFANGKVKCWGNGLYTGYGSSAIIGDNETPSSVDFVNISTAAVVQIAVARYHSCALLANGRVRCWGNAQFGRLGYGNLNNIGDTEEPAEAGDVNVDAVHSVTQICTGDFHTCVLLTGDLVKCWGRGTSYGYIGYGSEINIGDDEEPSSMNYVHVSLTLAPRQLACGAEHTCALLSNGGIHCWGRGSWGRLGYGNVQNIGDDEMPWTPGEVSLGFSVNGFECPPPTPLSTSSPTKSPLPMPTSFPSPYPSPFPTSQPSKAPTKLPTPPPTFFPTPLPSQLPTKAPTKSPIVGTAFPTPPTLLPTPFPSPPPTNAPTLLPSPSPTTTTSSTISSSTTTSVAITNSPTLSPTLLTTTSAPTKTTLPPFDSPPGFRVDSSNASTSLDSIIIYLIIAVVVLVLIVCFTCLCFVIHSRRRRAPRQRQQQRRSSTHTSYTTVSNSGHASRRSYSAVNVGDQLQRTSYAGSRSSARRGGRSSALHAYPATKFMSLVNTGADGGGGGGGDAVLESNYADSTFLLNKQRGQSPSLAARREYDYLSISSINRRVGEEDNNDDNNESSSSVYCYSKLMSQPHRPPAPPPRRAPSSTASQSSASSFYQALPVSNSERTAPEVDSIYYPLSTSAPHTKDHVDDTRYVSLPFNAMK